MKQNFSNRVVLMVYILAVLLFFFLLLLTYVKISLSFHRIKEDDNIEINLFLLFGIIHLKYSIPYLDFVIDKNLLPGFILGKKKETKETTEKKLNINDIIESYKKFKDKLSMFRNTFNYLLSKLRIDSIKWHTEIGLDDACITAIAVGAAYALKSSLLGLLTGKVTTYNVETRVTPNYSKFTFQMNLNCIIRIRIVNIIIAGIRIAPKLLSNKINHKGSGTSERASNSGINENYDG